MSHTKGSLRRALLTGLLLAAGASLPAHAQTTNTIGESFPPLPNVSLAPDWKVYYFDNAGIRYIQINDSNGKVLAVIQAANGTLIPLPLGSDAQRVSTPTSPQVPQGGTPVKIYDDGATTVSASALTPTTNQFTTNSSTTICPTCTHQQQN